jgi:hypothetical protein
MTSSWHIRSVIVACLLSAAVLLGGCSPPLPKAWLPPAGDRMYDIPASNDAKHAITVSPLTTRR